MTSARVGRIHRGLIAALVTIYVGAGTAGFFVDFDSTGSMALWFLFLFGGAVLILAGSLLRTVPARLSAILVSVGAIAGAIPLFWTVLVPIAAALLIGLTFSLSRHAGRGE